jgi:hypothetical protein
MFSVQTPPYGGILPPNTAVSEPTKIRNMEIKKVYNGGRSDYSHSLMVPSHDADASVLPSGEKAAALTLLEWSPSVLSAAPDWLSHSLMALFHDADASVLPSGEKATAMTLSEWPSSVLSAAPDRPSHSLAVLSSDAGASVVPSGEKATALTVFE